MNFRIFETPAGPLLVYRDQDEDGYPQMAFRVDTPHNTIITQAATLTNRSMADVQLAIQEMTPKMANDRAIAMMSFHDSHNYQ